MFTPLIALLTIPADTPLISTVSTGAAFSMERALAPEKPTVFVFYQASSSADKAVVDDLQARARKAGNVGLRLVKLPSLSAPAAQEFSVAETPTLMLLDRFGKLKVRTSKIDELGPAVVHALHMARIAWVDEESADAPRVYRMMGGGQRPVPGIMKTMSLHPEWMETIARIAGEAHFSDGALPHKSKEMIATYVSAINHCKF